MNAQGISVEILKYLRDSRSESKNINLNRLLELEPDRDKLIQEFKAQADYFATRDPWAWCVYSTLAKRLTTSSK